MILPFQAGRHWTKLKAISYSLFFDQISISYDWQNPKDISFIKDLKHLKGLVIESAKSFDLTPIQDCDEVTYLNLACKLSKGTKLDISKLPISTYLGADEAGLASIYQSKTVKKLTISGARLKDFSKTNLVSLERLVVDGSKELESLKGLEKLENLRFVELIRCPNIKNPTQYFDGDSRVHIYVNNNRLN